MTHDSHEKALLECAGTDTENQRVSEAAQDRFASKSSLLSSNTTMDVPGPTAGLLLRVVEHIPDDYRNSASTFMIVIITRPLHPCSYSS